MHSQFDVLLEIVLVEVLSQMGLGYPSIIGVTESMHCYLAVGNLGIPLIDSALKKNST